MTQIPAESTAWSRAGLPEERAVGHYGPGYGDPVRHGGDAMPAPHRPRADEALQPFPEARGGPSQRERHDAHPMDADYRRWREQHERELDEAYRAWCRDRLDREFSAWRSSRRTLGETASHGQPQTFFERS